MYSSTLSLTSELDGGGWSAPRLGRFTLGEKPGTHCRGGWVGPRTDLDVDRVGGKMYFLEDILCYWEGNHDYILLPVFIKLPEKLFFINL